MPRYLSAIPTLLLVAGLASPAAASRVVVPTDAPTIQAAIDGSADTIGVLDWVAPERLTIARSIVIEPVVGSVPNFLNSWTTNPLVQSLEIISNNEGLSISVRGVRFLGKVDASGLISSFISDHLSFEACRFDSGFAGPGGGITTTFAVLRVQGCLFLGDANLSGYVQFIGNTIIGGTLRIRADGVHDIRNNFVQGPAVAGMELRLAESIGQVSRNTVRGTGDGLRFIGNDPVRASLNDVADCTGTGMDFHSVDLGGAVCDSNSIARCGGTGILVRADSPTALPRASMSGNVIRQTGLDGITVADGLVNAARYNTILDAGGNGFTARGAVNFEHNVIGRSGAAGISLAEDASLAGNTIFSNQGPGLRIPGAYVYSGYAITHNISAFNAGPGLLSESGHTPQLSCNDWFGNAGGQTVGIPPSYSDVSINPRFCDLGAGDVSLSASSPLLNDPNCGLIGALGQGCVGTTDVAEDTPSSAALFRVSPTPARGAVSFTLPTSTVPAQIEVFDVTGARRWESTIPAGATRLEWDGRGNAGQRVPPGVYFARLRRDGASFPQVRMVLTK